MSGTFFDIPNTHDPIFFECILIRPVLDAFALEGTRESLLTSKPVVNNCPSPARDNSKKRAYHLPSGCQEKKGVIQTSKAAKREEETRCGNVSLVPTPCPTPTPTCQSRSNTSLVSSEDERSQVGGTSQVKTAPWQAEFPIPALHQSF